MNGLATLPRPSQTNCGASPPFVLVKRGHAEFCHGSRSRQVAHLELDPTLTKLETLHRVRTVLFDAGWVLGVDQWRDPLDPKVGLWATAHCYPYDPMHPNQYSWTGRP
jgi:hypothetical protein